MNLSDYTVLNQSLLDLVHSVNVLKAVPSTSEPVSQIRLKENPYIITTSSKRALNAVTAHDLNQYRKQIVQIKLNEDIETWHDILLEETNEVSTF